MSLFNAIMLIVLFAWLLPRLTGITLHNSMILGSLLLLSHPLESLFRFSSHAAVMALSLGVWWLLVRREDRPLAGLAVSIAVVLRLFPVLVLIPAFYHRRFRSWASAIGFSIVLMLAGMVVFGVSLAESVKNLTDAATPWIGHAANGSVSSAIVRAGLPAVTASLTAAALLLGAMVGIVRTRCCLDHALGLAVVVGLLGSPLVWEHYLLMVLPVWPMFRAALADRLGRAVALLAVAFLALTSTSLTFGVPAIGIGTLGVLSASLAHVGLDARRHRRSLT